MTFTKALAILLIIVTGAAVLAAMEGNKTAAKWLLRGQVITGVAYLADLIVMMS